jgi:hypothetical protein
MRAGRGLAALLAAVAAVALALTPGAAAKHHQNPKPAKAGKLTLGIWENLYESPDAGERARWLDATVAAGATQVTLPARWRLIATGAPAEPSNPADGAYDFEGLDAAVRDATARGLAPRILINQAPDYAEGPNRDPGANPGTWAPEPARLAEFARAIATRYSGSFPDPLQPGASLPRVSLWEIWGEPNLFSQLTPQTEHGKLVAPQHFRRMVNAASSAIKAVSASNQVIAGATAPFGDHPTPIGRIPPLTFWRAFFCLHGKKLKAQKKCPGGKPRVDAFSHNPLAGLAGNELLPTLGPADKAPSAGDILVPDMHKLYDVLKAARKQGNVKPRNGTELWVSELLWETNPPDETHGVAPETQAAYLTQSLQSLREQGVSNVTWVTLVDQPLDGGPGSLQSGLYYADGTPKPSLEAFQNASLHP